MSAGSVRDVGRSCLVACSVGYRCGKSAAPATLQDSSPVLGSSGGSSPMVCRRCWCSVLACMAKAAGLGLPAAFGALCALGVYGFMRWGISI